MLRFNRGGLLENEDRGEEGKESGTLIVKYQSVSLVASYLISFTFEEVIFLAVIIPLCTFILFPLPSLSAHFSLSRVG